MPRARGLAKSLDRDQRLGGLREGGAGVLFGNAAWEIGLGPTEKSDSDPDDDPPTSKIYDVSFWTSQNRLHTFRIELLCRKSLSESTENNAKTSPKNRTASH